VVIDKIPDYDLNFVNCSKLLCDDIQKNKKKIKIKKKIKNKKKRKIKKKIKNKKNKINYYF
jgi:hypothetical protein